MSGFADSSALEFKADLNGTDVSAPRSTVVVASDDVLDDAARLTALHELRADDAVQFASALALREVDATAARLCAGGRGRGRPQGAGQRRGSPPAGIARGCRAEWSRAAAALPVIRFREPGGGATCASWP